MADRSSEKTVPLPSKLRACMLRYAGTGHTLALCCGAEEREQSLETGCRQQ